MAEKTFGPHKDSEVNSCVRHLSHTCLFQQAQEGSCMKARVGWRARLQNVAQSQCRCLYQIYDIVAEAVTSHIQPLHTMTLELNNSRG